jgi:hypothetical protein
MYVINNDKLYELFIDPRETLNSSATANLNDILTQANQAKDTAWMNAYSAYWNNIVSNNQNSTGIINDCQNNYSTYISGIINDIGGLIENEQSCTNYKSGNIDLTNITNNLGNTGVDEIYSINLADTSGDVRLKGTCLTNVFNNATEVKTRLSNYNDNTNMLDKCEHVQVVSNT